MAQFMEKADAYLKVCKKSFKITSYFVGSMIFFSNFINVAILVVGGLLINQADELWRAGGLLPLRGPVYETADARF